MHWDVEMISWHTISFKIFQIVKNFGKSLLETVENL